VLQETVMPPCSEPTTVQTPAHDWRQAHEIDDVPHGLLPHVASTAPPATMKQS
jgi:hypothetical protein